MVLGPLSPSISPVGLGDKRLRTPRALSLECVSLAPASCFAKDEWTHRGVLVFCRNLLFIYIYIYMSPHPTMSLSLNGISENLNGTHTHTHTHVHSCMHTFPYLCVHFFKDLQGVNTETSALIFCSFLCMCVYQAEVQPKGSSDHRWFLRVVRGWTGWHWTMAAQVSQWV